MAKILDSTAMSGSISKMVEMSDGFLINGQVYDKNTLSPNPFDFCQIPSSNSNEMYLYQTAFVNSQYYRNRTTNGYLVDNTDPSICYVATQGLLGKNVSAAAVHKISRDLNGNLIDLTYTFSTYTYTPFIDLIGQDSQKIYFTVNRSYTGDYSVIGSINKATMIGTYVAVAKLTIKLLKDTDMYMYIAGTTISSTTYNIGKYDKVNNTITWLLTDAASVAGGYYSDVYPSDMDSNGVFYCMKDGISIGLSDHSMSYKKYVLNTSKDTIVSSIVNVDMSIFPSGKILMSSVSDNNIDNTLLNFTDSNTGKKYITHIVYNKGTATITLKASDCAMYTYEIIDDDNWKLVSYTNFNPIIWKAFLPVLNNQTIMFAYENGCHIYTWNTATTSYEKVSSFDQPVMTIGQDSNNNLYVQYTDTSIEMISNVMPITVYADFEEEVYNYKGTDITTNIIAYIYNYQGKYLSSSLQLNLFGNCKFTDTGLRTKTITTSNLDKISIPVSITDSGNLRVAVKLL